MQLPFQRQQSVYIFLNLQYGEVEEEIANFSNLHNVKIVNINEIDIFNDIWEKRMAHKAQKHKEDMEKLDKIMVQAL